MGNREQLSRAAWEAFYEASYYEILFNQVSKRWQFFDFITRSLIAITASGSAIAGWALWSDPNFKDIWLFAAGLASLLSIVHALLNTPDKLQNYSNLASSVSSVRYNLESFRHELKIYPKFDIDVCFEKHSKLRDALQIAIETYSPDFLTTYKLENSAQTLLNIKLGVEE